MQTDDDDAEILITFYSKDPGSNQDNECETFYSTDCGSWIAQGKRRGVKVEAQLVGLAADEAFLEISGPTMDLFVRKYVKERYGLDLAEGTGRSGQRDQP